MSKLKGNPGPAHDLSALAHIKPRPNPQRKHAHFRHEDAVTIRQFVLDAGKPRGMMQQIARKFRVAPVTIWGIVDGRYYK